ncbi:MAG: helix-turn-helix domain-containing protein [Microthrixaceae bacterium]
MAESDEADRRIAGIASLEQPLRRDLYRLLAHSERWLTRDEAADALDMARSVAAFHLEKMVEAGILETRFERLSGRSGPGAGRPSKLYRPSGAEVSASVPDRHYDLAGSLLAAAVVESTTSGVAVDECLRSVAYSAGSDIAARATADGEEGADQLEDLLDAQGYEPQVIAGDEPDRSQCSEIALANCPFHRLVEEHRELVCDMNLNFLSGVIEGLDSPPTVAARLQPEPGYCCVRIGGIRASSPTPQE